MTAPQENDRQKRFRYHHGNLRDALIQSALDILQTEGPENLSLRTLARATGVTQAAPYSHFKDKSALLAAIAETGFRRLALAMAAAATGVQNPQARLEKLMTAYVRFAVENRPLFRLMFSNTLSDMKPFPTLAMTAGKSYALISAALSAQNLSAQKPAQADAGVLTVAVWSLCQGLSSLLIDDRLDVTRHGAADIDDFVKTVAGVFTQN